MSYIDRKEISKALDRWDKTSIKTMTRCMSGNDYDNGELEALQEGLDNAHEAIARLIFILMRNKVLNHEEAIGILEKYSFGNFLGEKL